MAEFACLTALNIMPIVSSFRATLENLLIKLPLVKKRKIAKKDRDERRARLFFFHLFFNDHFFRYLFMSINIAEKRLLRKFNGTLRGKRV